MKLKIQNKLIRRRRLKIVKSCIILALRKDQDLKNLFNFLGIPSSFEENFIQKNEIIKELINVGLVDENIFKLDDHYNIFVSNKDIELKGLNEKHRDLFANSINPEMLVGIDLLLLVGVNKNNLNFLSEHPEYKDKFRKFVRSLLSYLQDHSYYISSEVK